MADYYSKNKGATFQEIIWETLKTLREKCSKEFRTPQEKIIIHSDWNEKFIEEDSRKEFCQIVEFLSDILSQEFKPETLKKYNEIFKEVKEEREKTNKNEDVLVEDYILFKVEKMRELLRLMMLDMKLRKYFKGLGQNKEEETQE